MPASKGLWEELGISIGDILAKQAEIQAKIVHNLAGKLENLSPEFLPFIKTAFGISGNSIEEILEILYAKSMPDFVDLYALAIFADRGIDPEIVYSVAKGKLQDELERRIENRSVDSSVVLLPLLKADEKSIRKIHYAYIIQRSASKRYVSEPAIAKPLEPEKVDFKTIESLLKAFETKKAAKNRRPVKLWWFDTSNGAITVIFRREKKGSTQIKLVERNLFQKTGDEKIFLIIDGGNVLELHSRREPKRTLRLAEYIMGQLTGNKVTYAESLNAYESTKFATFVTKLCSNGVPNTELMSLRVKNVPLPNSPTMELESSDCLVPAINELEDVHNLSLMRPPHDVVGLRIKVNGCYYNIKTRVQGNLIELVLDNRNLSDEEKQTLKQLLFEQLS
jgi:hypothetical protein